MGEKTTSFAKGTLTFSVGNQEHVVDITAGALTEKYEEKELHTLGSQMPGVANVPYHQRWVLTGTFSPLEALRAFQDGRAEATLSFESGEGPQTIALTVFGFEGQGLMVNKND